MTELVYTALKVVDAALLTGIACGWISWLVADITMMFERRGESDVAATEMPPAPHQPTHPFNQAREAMIAFMKDEYGIEVKRPSLVLIKAF